MSLRNYKKKWGVRSYLGPAGRARAALESVRREQEQKRSRNLRRTAKAGAPASGSTPQRRAFPKERKPIARRSPERRKADRIYNARVKAWLAEPEQMWSAVELALNGKLVRATQCHHRNGRGWRGELLMEESLWIPVSAEGHAWIDANRESARRLGLLAPLGQWNRKPPEAKP